MLYNKVNKDIFLKIKKLLGSDNVFIEKDILGQYSHDQTEDLIFYPELVVKPKTTKDISGLMQICYNNNIPVTPRGAGTGLSGGALPVKGGVVLSVERMNEIIEIDTHNLQATVQPGVINQVFQDELKKHHLFYPPDPASKGSCFLGGNVAENAGGPKALKYGVTKDYVLNLELVLPNGDVINTGANVLKNATGYNLTQLIVGSEGTLAVITKIVFKILPLPKHDVTILVPFDSIENACSSVSDVFIKGVTPCALEFMEREAVDLAMEYKKTDLKIEKNVEAHLLIELDGNDLDLIMKDCEIIYEVMNSYGAGDILFADNNRQKENLWSLRRSVGEAVKMKSIYKEEDTVVPRANLPKMISGVKEIGLKYGFRSVCYGHAGDGNLHVNIMKDSMSSDKWNNVLDKAIKDIFVLCVQLKGTISGEHGIGYVQKKFMNIPFDDVNLNMQKKINIPKTVTTFRKIIFRPRIIQFRKKSTHSEN